MKSDKTILLKPEGLLDQKAIQYIIAEIALSKVPYARIDCSEITTFLAEAVSALKKELANFQGGLVEIEFYNLNPSMVLQFQLYDFLVEKGNVIAFSGEMKKEGVRQVDFSKENVYSIICKQCNQNLKVHSRGLHACPNCGSRMYVDRFGRSRFYEPLRMLQK